MNRYIVILRHAGGNIHCSMSASSAQRALEQVCEFEGAPHSAVMGVIDKGAIYPLHEQTASPVYQKEIRK